MFVSLFVFLKPLFDNSKEKGESSSLFREERDICFSGYGRVGDGLVWLVDVCRSGFRWFGNGRAGNGTSACG